MAKEKVYAVKNPKGVVVAMTASHIDYAKAEWARDMKREKVANVPWPYEVLEEIPNGDVKAWDAARATGKSAPAAPPAPPAGDKK